MRNCHRMADVMDKRLIANLRWLAALLLLGIPSAIPTKAIAQIWSVELQRVTIDDRTSGRIGGSADRIPQGFGFAVRFTVESMAFFEVNVSQGRESRLGAVCGGFIIDPDTQCIPETVRYAGSLMGFFVGWPGRVSVGSGLSLGLRPRIGLAALSTDEVGSDTGRSYEERTRSLVLGFAADVSYHLRGTALSVVASAGLDRIDPYGGEICLDCRKEFEDALRQIVWGVGVIWRP
jgi:hypothetical protein